MPRLGSSDEGANDRTWGTQSPLPQMRCKCAIGQLIRIVCSRARRRVKRALRTPPSGLVPGREGLHTDGPIPHGSKELRRTDGRESRSIGCFTSPPKGFILLYVTE